jgi:hypothetical protein
MTSGDVRSGCPGVNPMTLDGRGQPTRAQGLRPSSRRPLPQPGAQPRDALAVEPPHARRAALKAFANNVTAQVAGLRTGHMVRAVAGVGLSVVSGARSGP